DDHVLQANPPTAVLVQSKRLPLAASRLGLSMPTWNAILPPASEIGLRRFAPRLLPPGRGLEPAWGRIGEGGCGEGVTESRTLRRSAWRARCFPRSWLLQERFESASVGDGFHASFGVYVIDGRASGVYARVAQRPLIDARAQDAAVVLDPTLDASN